MARSSVERLRAKLGDTGTPQAFMDAELEDLLDEADNVFGLALAEGLWELLTNAARLNDYTVGLSSEKKSQVFTQLRALYQTVTAQNAGADESARQQVAMLTLVGGSPTTLSDFDLSRVPEGGELDG